MIVVGGAQQLISRVICSEGAALFALLCVYFEGA